MTEELDRAIEIGTERLTEVERRLAETRPHDPDALPLAYRAERYSEDVHELAEEAVERQEDDPDNPRLPPT